MRTALPPPRTTTHSTRREPSASPLDQEQRTAEADPEDEDGAASTTLLRAFAARVSLMS